jgi:hypothetical protein
MFKTVKKFGAVAIPIKKITIKAATNVTTSAE